MTSKNDTNGNLSELAVGESIISSCSDLGIKSSVFENKRYRELLASKNKYQQEFESIKNKYTSAVKFKIKEEIEKTDGIKNITVKFQEDCGSKINDLRDLIVKKKTDKLEETFGIQVKHHNNNIKSPRIGKDTDILSKLTNGHTFDGYCSIPFVSLASFLGKRWKNMSDAVYEQVISGVQKEIIAALLKIKDNEKYTEQLLNFCLSEMNYCIIGLHSEKQSFVREKSKYGSVKITNINETIGTIKTTKSGKRTLKNLISVEFDNQLEISFRLHTDGTVKNNLKMEVKVERDPHKNIKLFSNIKYMYKISAIDIKTFISIL